jgi:DNA-binding transcriptional LysR family regulator
MQPDLTWDNLRFALAIHREGTLAAAARSMAVQLTTVSRRLDALENEARARLFTRSSHGLTPTPAGKLILATAERVEAEVLHAERQLSAESTVQVRLAMTDTTAERLLLEGASELLALQGTELELITGNAPADIASRQADLAIRLAKPRGAGLVASRLGALEYGLYVSDPYLKRHGRPTLSTLDQHAVVLGTGELGAGPEGQWMSKASRGARVALRTNSLLALRTAITAGLGAGVLPITAAAKRPLQCVHTLGRATRREVWLVTHEDLRNSPRVRAVADAVKAVLAAGYRED